MIGIVQGCRYRVHHVRCMPCVSLGSSHAFPTLACVHHGVRVVMQLTVIGHMCCVLLMCVVSFSPYISSQDS
jgi:hypothetical protein